MPHSTTCVQLTGPGPAVSFDVLHCVIDCVVEATIARLMCAVLYCTVVFVCAAGNILTCNLSLANTGNVRLTNITAGGHAINCGIRQPTLLWPGTAFFCTLSRFIIQDDFELGNVDLNFPIGAQALGLVNALDQFVAQPFVVYNVKLPVQPSLELVTSMDPNFVTWPGGCLSVLVPVMQLHVACLRILLVSLRQSEKSNIQANYLQMFTGVVAHISTCHCCCACAGDLVVYSVQLLNRGNVHLKSVNLNPVTNSSTNGMNTTFPMDCGIAGALPRLLMVDDMFTCTRTIEFTTPVSCCSPYRKACWCAACFDWCLHW